MRKLNISITKAQLTSFTVELKDGKPEVNVTIALLTEGGKAITTYQIGTDSWRSDTKFDLPVEIMPLIGDTARILEAVAVRHCQQGQLALAATASKKSNKTSGLPKLSMPEPDDVAIEDISDKPINLDDIPF